MTSKCSSSADTLEALVHVYLFEDHLFNRQFMQQYVLKYLLVSLIISWIANFERRMEEPSPQFFLCNDDDYIAQEARTAAIANHLFLYYPRTVE
jgi:hypothetical protein